MEGEMSDMQTKRGAILTQAINAFAEDGFQGADVQMIAERAGVGYGTVYRHFSTKLELFRSATYTVLEGLGAQVREAVKGCRGAIGALRAAGLAYVGFFQANPGCLAVFLESRAEFHGQIPALHREFHEKLAQLFAEILERGIAEEEIRPLNARNVALSLCNVLGGITLFGCYGGDQCSMSESAKQTLDIFLRGIMAKMRGVLS
jgi:AcrR family transcriptional regulator